MADRGLSLSPKLRHAAPRATKMLFHTLFEHIANFLWPPTCLVCHGDTSSPHSLCASCWPEVTFITDPHCQRCGFPLPYSMDDGGATSTLHCLSCLAKKPLFQQAQSLLVYNDATSQIIIDYKNRPSSAMNPLVRGWINHRLPVSSLHASLRSLHNDQEEQNTSAAGGLSFFPRHRPPTLLIAPVPMHWRRLFWRSYNPAARLAKVVHDTLRRSIPSNRLVPDLLIKSRSTPSQGKLTRSKRLRNVRGSFAVHPRWMDKLPHPRPPVVLVDDVWTTGATLTACCQALKKAKFDSIYILTLARVV